MSDMSPISSAKLALLIPRLASDQDGEVVATARAIIRTLAARGLDLHDLAAVLVPVADPVEAERVRWWAELRGLGERKGYRSGWLHHTFEARFPGADPPWPEPAPRMPSAEVSLWCRARAARWARQKMRGGS